MDDVKAAETLPQKQRSDQLADRFLKKMRHDTELAIIRAQEDVSIQISQLQTLA